MKNPLCRYDKFVDVIDFLGSSFTLHTDRVFVPFAEKCYFFAPIFNKFNFELNFADDAAYCFWKIFIEDRSLIREVLAVFQKYNLHEDDAFLNQMLAQETRPVYKAILFLMLSDPNYDRNFKSSYSLRTDKVVTTKSDHFDYSSFILHSHVNKPFLNDGSIIKQLNKFKSKIVIANNPAICEFIQHDSKHDFDECFILVSTQ
jgi:hypothetical protein